ncbi:MAG: ABC transporter permease [Bacteroidales bacterium]|nr:ABC transporter permease [Bacteroidales bacterium]
MIAFELKVQLQSKAFWLLSLIPPAALVLILSVNLNTRYKNNIVIYNTSSLILNFESDNTAEFYVETEIEYPVDEYVAQKGKVDALVYVQDNDEGGVNCFFYEKRTISNENKSRIIASVKEEMLRTRLGNILVQTRDSIEKTMYIMSVPCQNSSVLYGMSTASVFLIYFVILQFASSVMGAIGREKKNKISEILLSAMSGGDILMGKLLSGFIAAVLQVLFWLLLACVSAMLMGWLSNGPFRLETITSILGSITSLPIGKLMAFTGVFCYCFAGGYFLYSALFSFVGAISNENTNTRQFSLLLTVPLLLTFIYVVKYPNSEDALMQFVIYFPMCSPISLLPKYVNGLPLWEVLLSSAILFASTVMVIVYSSRLYATGVLASRARITLKTILKWIKTISK